MLLPTTTITVVRPNGAGDPYETAAVSTVATGQPAHISAPTGSAARIGGSKQVIDALLLVDPTPAYQRADLVTDDGTGQQWTVEWVQQRQGVGFDHQTAGLVAVAGGSSG